MTELRDPSPVDLAGLADPFLAWHLGPAIRRLWHSDGASIAHVRGWRDDGLWATGTAAAQLRLLDMAVSGLAADGVGAVRLRLAPETYDRIPAGLRCEGPPRLWTWMLADRAPAGSRDARIETLPGSAGGEIQAFLDAENPTHHAQPGDPDVIAWLGARHPAGGALVGAGALTHNAAGMPYLRAITTAAGHRGCGWGTAVSAALTLEGFARHRMVSLGVYSDNTAARHVYHRLGFRDVVGFGSVDAQLAANAPG